MSKLIVYHDDGGGITQRSLEYWKKIRQPGWHRFRIKCSAEMHFSTEVTCFDKDSNYIVILMSGFNCAYGGEGPHGLLTLLESCGYEVTDSVKQYVFENRYVAFTK